MRVMCMHSCMLCFEVLSRGQTMRSHATPVSPLLRKHDSIYVLQMHTVGELNVYDMYGLFT